MVLRYKSRKTFFGDHLKKEPAPVLALFLDWKPMLQPVVFPLDAKIKIFTFSRKFLPKSNQTNLFR